MSVLGRSLDKAYNRKTDVQTAALALVLHDYYVSPSVERGARGSGRQL